MTKLNGPTLDDIALFLPDDLREQAHSDCQCGTPLGFVRALCRLEGGEFAFRDACFTLGYPVYTADVWVSESEKSIARRIYDRFADGGDSMRAMRAVALTASSTHTLRFVTEDHPDCNVGWEPSKHLDTWYLTEHADGSLSVEAPCGYWGHLDSSRRCTEKHYWVEGGQDEGVRGECLLDSGDGAWPVELLTREIRDGEI